MHHDGHDAYDDDYEAEDIEGYCMRCRASVIIEDPLAVWTRKGQPAVRGLCPTCGGVVFRMGRTELHDGSRRPDAVQVGDEGRRSRPRLARDTIYINYAEADEELAQQLAADLEKAGLAVWLHEHISETDPVRWAGGVHPALKQCARMVLVLSAQALEEGKVRAAWSFFRDKRKQVIIAQVSDGIEPPDAIRRSPRFNFAADYRRAFREMMQYLGG